MTMTITLNNGVEMPALGLGVFQTPPQVTADAVEAALRVGYRHIDTAAVYANEREVGEGIRRSGVDPAEIFVETKVWPSDYGHDETVHAFEKSSRKLGIDRIDLLILHWPAPLEGFDRTIAAYRGLETLLSEGRVRAIGVSNFEPRHLEALLKEITVAPTVNQVELHPYFAQREIRAANAAHGVLTQAWSPIGGVTVYGRGASKVSFQDPVLLGIGAEHGKTAAQVMLRWHLQQGRSAIPKSVHAERIAENFDVFDFELTDEQLAAIDALDTGTRGGGDPETFSPTKLVGSIPEA